MRLEIKLDSEDQFQPWIPAERWLLATVAQKGGVFI